MMNWSLRERTQQERAEEVNLKRGYGDKTATIEKDSCQYVVTKSNGEVKEVWDLSEKEVFNLIKKNMTELNGLSKSQKHLDWTFKIISCWCQKHPNPSAEMISQLNKLPDLANNGAAKEAVRDMMGPIANKKMAEARLIAKYLNGGNPPSKDQITAVIDNQAKMEMSKSSQGQTL